MGVGIPYYSHVYSGVSTSSVVIWSDVLGGVHVWQSSILWYQCNESADSSAEWREAREANQCCLL